MSIWEKAILSVEKGSRKVAATAAVFSERVKVELAIIRLRTKIRDVEDRIGRLHQSIGVRLVELIQKDRLPKTTDTLLLDEEIAAILSALSTKTGELDGLRSDLKDLRADMETAEKETEETLE